MKKGLVGFLAVALVAGMSALVYAGIAGSSHDFTDGQKGYKGNTAPGTAQPFTEIGAGGWNSRGEICRVCHVPHDHGRTTRYTGGLLWNHELSTASYTLYDSPTMDYKTVAPVGTAKLCLSCHDGTVAIDNFDSHTATPVNFGNPGGYDGGYEIGFGTGDLSGTHPISMNYPMDGVTGEFNAATTPWSAGGTISSTLDNGRVQCSTCHDVHSQEVVAGTHLLRAAQTGATPSGLCLTCHIK